MDLREETLGNRAHPSTTPSLHSSRRRLPFPLAAESCPRTLGAMATATAYDSKIEGNVIFTRLDAALNWVHKNSLWPMPMGLACCAIELMATAASRFDIARFGAEVMRFSPRQ